jgi:hypothetical protein
MKVLRLQPVDDDNNNNNNNRMTVDLARFEVNSMLREWTVHPSISHSRIDCLYTAIIVVPSSLELQFSTSLFSSSFPLKLPPRPKSLLIIASSQHEQYVWINDLEEWDAPQGKGIS